MINNINQILKSSQTGSFSGTINKESSHIKDLLEKLNNIKYGWEVLTNKKDKLKKTAFMCSQEMKKLRVKTKELTKNNQILKEDHNTLEKNNMQLNDRLILLEEKLEYYKKQEMEISLRKSYQSVTSDDLNTKLIQQNQEILERFHQEEERCQELEKENEHFRDQREKARKKIMNLKMEIKVLIEEKESSMFGQSNAEMEQLLTSIQNLRDEKSELEEENERLAEESEKVQIACDTFERKLNDLIDKHNEDIMMYEDEIENLKVMIEEQKNNNESSSRNIQNILNSQLQDSDNDFNKFKESLIHNKQLETMNQNLKAENAELKLDILGIKQKHMSLLNKYSMLKKKMSSK
jgi:chromosome segregation ATPase